MSNRAQRRQAEKDKKKMVSKLKRTDLNAPELREFVRTTSQIAVADAVTSMIAIFLMALHDKHGWGTKRCSALLEEIDDLADSVGRGYVNVDDLKQTLLEEVGITLE